MKKIISILLILLILCLTACNKNIEDDTSVSEKQSEQTESTSISQTTETTKIQTSDTTSSIQETQTSETTTEKTEIPEIPKGYEIPAALQDKIIQKGNPTFIELPSRILFSHYLNSGKWVGDRYQIDSGRYLSYYSKADGEVYINCFDPLCEHEDCSANGGAMGPNSFFIRNRFYMLINYEGQMLSFNFDGTDTKVEYVLEDDSLAWKSNNIAYDKYIFIQTLLSNGEKHTFRYDVETKAMEDLTGKTGNYIEPWFVYNGIIYGYNADGLSIKTDLDLSYEEETEYLYGKAFYDLVSGHRLIGVAYGDESNADGFTSYIGIQTYDMKTGTETLISNETIGKEVSQILYADENYYYFLADDQIYIGKSRSNHDMYNNYGGKIYRVNRDGTNCICIYDNKGMTFNSMIVYEDTVIVSASEIGVHGGIAQTWANGMYIGEINEDGTIDSLEWVEVIA